MTKVKFLAVLMTVVLLFSVCAAGSSVLVQGLLGISNAQETNNDLDGLLEGLEIDPNGLSGLMGESSLDDLNEYFDNFEIDDVPGLLGGLFGLVSDSDNVNDDQLSTITTIVQALLGGTQEGESTLDAIKEKLGDLGGTVSENELIQAIVSTLMGFDFSNFDMSMLTSNDFISALTETLGGLNLGGAQQIPGSSQQTTQSPTQSVIITTAPTLAATPGTNTQTPTTVPSSNTLTPTTLPDSTTPTQPQANNVTNPTNSTVYSGGVGVIVDNTTAPTQLYVENTSIPTVPGITDAQQQNTPDGTKSLVSGKMIVGMIVLLLSGISVVAVVLVLKKNKP